MDLYLILASGPCNIIKGKINAATEPYQREGRKIKYKREKIMFGEVDLGLQFGVKCYLHRSQSIRNTKDTHLIQSIPLPLPSLTSFLTSFLCSHLSSLIGPLAVPLTCCASFCLNSVFAVLSALSFSPWISHGSPPSHIRQVFLSENPSLATRYKIASPQPHHCSIYHYTILNMHLFLYSQPPC